MLIQESFSNESMDQTHAAFTLLAYSHRNGAYTLQLPRLDISLSVSSIIVMLASRMENHWVWSHQLQHVCGHCRAASL